MGSRDEGVPGGSYEEFIANPSRISMHLVDIVLGLNEKHESLLNSKSALKHFGYHFRVNMYLKDAWRDYYSYLQDYRLPQTGGMSSVEKIKSLFSEFERLYDKLIFNNFALAYAYAKTKEISSPVLTMEDKKVLYLKRLYNGEITPVQFNEVFGHYALNAYELSSKRFEEYGREELLAIARLVSNLELKEKVPLEEYVKSKSPKPIPVLIALRELAKYNILFVVRDIRYELLKIAGERGIKDVFGKSYDDIIGMR